MARTRTSRRAAAQPRQPRATSRKKPAPSTTSAEVEVVEEAKGLGTEDAVAIITAVILFVGILFLDYELGTHYDPHGLFF